MLNSLGQLIDQFNGDWDIVIGDRINMGPTGFAEEVQNPALDICSSFDPRHCALFLSGNDCIPPVFIHMAIVGL